MCKTCIYKYTAPNRYSRWPGLHYLVYYYTPQQHLYFYTCVLLYFKYIVLVFVISQRSDHNEQFRCFFWNSSAVALCFRAFLQTRAVWLGMWRHAVLVSGFFYPSIFDLSRYIKGNGLVFHFKWFCHYGPSRVLPSSRLSVPVGSLGSQVNHRRSR